MVRPRVSVRLTTRPRASYAVIQIGAAACGFRNGGTALQEEEQRLPLSRVDAQVHAGKACFPIPQAAAFQAQRDNRAFPLCLRARGPRRVRRLRSGGGRANADVITREGEAGDRCVIAVFIRAGTPAGTADFTARRNGLRGKPDAGNAHAIEGIGTAVGLVEQGARKMVGPRQKKRIICILPIGVVALQLPVALLKFSSDIGHEVSHGIENGERAVSSAFKSKETRLYSPSTRL